MKKVFLLCLPLLFLTACSVDEIKPAIVDSLRTIITAKKDVTTAIIPNGDTEITIDGKTHTVKKETYEQVETIVETNSELQNQLVDIIGAQITDENIATIAYYADKYSVPVKDLLNSLVQTPEE